MKDLLDKLSSYNLFNYLLPGVLFVFFSIDSARYSFTSQDIIVGAFLCYFIGLVISRFGSLAIEPLLKRLSFIRYANYKEYILASKKDAKIEVLLEENNTYRTLTSLFVLLLFLKIYEKIENWLPVLKEWDGVILTVLLLITFLFSYKKQTDYIRKRVEANVSGGGNDGGKKIEDRYI